MGVIIYQYALMVQETIVIDSVGRSILKLETSSKFQNLKKWKKIRLFRACHLHDIIDEILG